MKRLLILILFVCSLVVASPLYAFDPLLVFSGQPEGEETFCTGGELFCADFETDGMIEWDSTPGTEDCDGYDADDDWCDYDTSNPMVGPHHMGIRGTNALQEALTSTATEFYIDFVWDTNRASGATSTFWAYNITNSIQIAGVYISAGLEIYVYLEDGNYLDTNISITYGTMYRIGLYYKKSTTTESNDGIVRVWINTDLSSFDDEAPDYSNTSLDCNLQYNAEAARFKGPATGQQNYYDNAKIDSGDPGWPTS